MAGSSVHCMAGAQAHAKRGFRDAVRITWKANQGLLRSPLVHPSVMLRIDAVLAVGNYRVQYPAAEDLDLFLRLMERYDCANLPELGLYYELNEGGISATKRRRQITSTLRLQARYLNVLNWRDWVGIAKSLLHFVTPYGALQRMKRALFARGA